MADSTVTYVTQTDLGHDAGVQQLDPAVKAALFGALDSDGVFDVPYPKRMERLPGSGKAISAVASRDLRRPFKFSRRPTVPALRPTRP